jgi:hypothetical protein
MAESPGQFDRRYKTAALTAELLPRSGIVAPGFVETGRDPGGFPPIVPLVGSKWVVDRQGQ